MMLLLKIHRSLPFIALRLKVDPVAPCEDVRRRGWLLLFLLRGQGLELPVLVHGFDGPVKLLAKCLGEEFLNGDVKFLGEDDGETGINVVLDQVSMS
jgi:hypothetical protein